MSKSPVTPALERRERRVLTDDVADSIREAILSGRIQGGERLIEDELAESLKVSRGPIRAAIFRLQQEGLVVHETHRGATVARVSAEDAEEIYTLRRALERLATENACLKATQADLAPLDAILLLFQSVPRASMTRRRVAELDIDFHDALFRAAHHGRLYRAWEALRSQIFVFLLLRDGLPDDYLTSWYRDHADLLQKVREGDVVKAVTAIDEHIQGAYARLKEHLQQDVPA
ncbi:DNA-binding GntR family transcriptional regulator [Kaistia defluvii]|uniref:DNA-binding GntR family transcriptional regulator n=1 Tax=Kaistia defluvii TaxID=410841 RepID=A0ABV2R1F1_9HYPH